jgi:hypothetical protein
LANSLISEEYRQQQKALHENPHYGVASQVYAPIVAKIINAFHVRELLDYGAGKQRLNEVLRGFGGIGHRWEYRAFEPADDACCAAPEPAEMVTCIDVLEHIEPECLDAVIDDLQRVTQRLLYATVHCGPAMKTLLDGRNAHLTQKPMRWWLPKLLDRFDVKTLTATPDGFECVLTPIGKPL